MELVGENWGEEEPLDRASTEEPMGHHVVYLLGCAHRDLVL
jgi:hypothetical protein